MKVRDYITQTLKKHKMHMTLIDPAKQSASASAEIAAKACRAGTDAIMVGGSTGVTQDNLDETVAQIKRACKLPVIYFPSGANAISRKCDAIYFMSMLNSRNVRNVSGEHARGAPMIKKLGIEPISMGYIIVEPGMKVGEVGEAELVKRGDVNTLIGYAIATEFFGMDLLYLEAGSGAPEPVPVPMVKAARESVDIPLVIGGGIVTPKQAADLAAAGADIIVTGTLVEHDDFEDRLKRIIDKVHEA
ncbi:MAG: geranylgeranylglyceryl/heptaprenylglyceryl phosphate synthase [Candidatus Thermoplasmatota archaeon]|nr:geranylgeranylglyceryl/heptaprenylglyceryl phosphate synthase [Candidatus Thermoplasmatota archaeon]